MICNTWITPSRLEVVQFLSCLFAGVCGVTLQFVQPQQVLGEDEQAGFAAGTLQAATVKAVHSTVAFGVAEATLDRLTS